MWRPGDGQRMHSIFSFENVRGIEAVLTTRTRYDTVVGSVVFAMLIAKLLENFFSLGPIDCIVLAFCKTTSIANTLIIKLDSRLF